MSQSVRTRCGEVLISGNHERATARLGSGGSAQQLKAVGAAHGQILGLHRQYGAHIR